RRGSGTIRPASGGGDVSRRRPPGPSGGAGRDVAGGYGRGGAAHPGGGGGQTGDASASGGRGAESHGRGGADGQTGGGLLLPGNYRRHVHAGRRGGREAGAGTDGARRVRPAHARLDGPSRGRWAA